jgi:hypothetical protein
MGVKLRGRSEVGEIPPHRTLQKAQCQGVTQNALHNGKYGHRTCDDVSLKPWGHCEVLDQYLAAYIHKSTLCKFRSDSFWQCGFKPVALHLCVMLSLLCVGRSLCVGASVCRSQRPMAGAFLSYFSIFIFEGGGCLLLNLELTYLE